MSKLSRKAQKIFTRLAIAGAVLACVFLVFFTPIGQQIQSGFITAPTPRADRLFKEFDRDAYALAQKIEWKQQITPRDIEPVAELVNQRFGDDITFLFHAISSQNLSAVDALLGSGADTTMTDKATRSVRDFVYYLSMPGARPQDPFFELDEINEMIRLYLRHGGDPDYRISGGKNPLIAAVALIGNIDGVRILLEAGADPWANADTKDNSENNMMTNINQREDQFEFINELISTGYFDKLTQKQLSGFFGSFGGYAQRGDEISRNIQLTTMRILKRNPHYVEESADWNTARIFKDHWQNPTPGVIPWGEIRSDAVN